MPTRCDTVAGAGQFLGTAGSGRFDFAFLDGIPRTSRVVLSLLSYSSEDGGDSGSVTFFAVRPAGLLTERVLLGQGNEAEIIGPVGTQGNVKFCGVVLPRDPPSASGAGNNGDQWRVVATTEGKTATGTVCVDYVIQPFPDTNPRDSGRGSGAA